MIRQGGGGRIINLSSQAGFVALPTESVYCMTKAAIAHLTKCLAVEWAPHGITVNAVAPTFIRTPGTVKWLADDDFRAELLARIPLGRVGDPVDVAGAVVFLASPAAALVTGATLTDRRRLDRPPDHKGAGSRRPAAPNRARMVAPLSMGGGRTPVSACSSARIEPPWPTISTGSPAAVARAAARATAARMRAMTWSCSSARVGVWVRSAR